MTRRMRRRNVSRRGMQQGSERACNGERPVLVSDAGSRDTENPYRARDAVTFFEPTSSERGSLRERGAQASPPLRRGSLKRFRDRHLVNQVQTRTGTRHNGRGCFFFLPVDRPVCFPDMRMR